MSLRETLNKKPGVVTGVTVGVILVALLLIFWQQRSAKPQPPPNKAYYTIDDGATTFEDDLDKATPFDHDGGKAVRVHMFSCNGGKTRFVGYLERQPDKQPAGAAPAAREGRRRVVEALVKPAKDPTAKWVPQISPEGSAIVAGVQCPDKSSTPPTEVFP